MNSKTVFEVGEIAALKSATQHLRAGDFAIVGTGDDAAVMRSSGDFVVTTDTMIENHDFKTEWSSGYDLGWKAAATNLADVAAMGARPISLVVALVVSKTTTVSWLEEFAKGLQAACDQLAPGCGVVGGDLAVGEAITIAVTAHGELAGVNPVLRSGAQVGDSIAIAGTLGRAACGLALLQHPDSTLAASYPDWIAVQLRPTPPIALGVKAAKSGSTAMLDVSDSLAKDLGRIAAASDVSMRLNRQALEGYFAILEQAAQSISSRGTTVSESDWVLFGGEDHALLATFPAEAKIPVGFKVIGQVIEKSDRGVYLGDEPLAEKGWDSVSD